MSRDFDERHKFARGNQLRKGKPSPMNRVTQLFRVQLLRAIKSRGVVPEVMDQLIMMATEGQRKVRTGEDGQVIYMPVDEKTQYGACVELLSRAVGRSTEYKIVEDARTADTASASDFEVVAGALKELGQPMDQWPPQVSEWYIRNERRRLEGPQA